ncbi:helix-turn-helix domain-containing protein [Pseudarthrobacter sp. BIM B-2242]|nr:helix-turn-helix domain-containing protein [Pseudarthrobacter sp. BIM B-2242]
MEVSSHRLMTMDEVAEETRIPVNTLRFYRQNGKGPKFAKLGGRLMARREDVDGWIQRAFETGKSA